MEKPQMLCHVEKSMNKTLFDVQWIPCSAKFVVLGSNPRGTGSISIFELNQGGLDQIKESEHSKSLRCGTFGATSLRERHLATGNFDGQLEVWDLERLTPSVYSAKAHDEIINAIDGVGGLGIGVGAPEIVTGSRDGSVKVWDVRQKDKPVAKMEPKEGDAHRDCWSVAFGNTYNVNERIVCAGYDNGDIKMFDMKSMSVLWEGHVKNGVCCVQFDRKDIVMNKLLVTTLDSKFHVYDLRTKNREKGFASLTEKSHKSTVWQGKHVPQNRDLFITTGGAGSMCLWKYEYPETRSKVDSNGDKVGVPGTLSLLQNCNVSSQPISAFSWSPDKLGLAACTSFDQTLRVLIVTKLNQY